MWDTLYLTILKTPYVTPMERVGTATFRAEVTTAERSHLQGKHAEACRMLENHHNIDEVLKALVLGVVDNTYVFIIHNLLKV